MHEVLRIFFSPHDFRDSFPNIWAGFQVNLKLMVVAEALVLVFALAIAVVRGLPGRGARPLRALAIVYTDFFRGTPLILVAFLVGFGLPGLNIHFISNRSNFVYGVIALTLVYTAYVTEVFRAGIESVHQSQRMAARSLGLSYCAGDAVRRHPAGGATGDPAAAERLHRAAEGHRPRLRDRRRRGGVPGAGVLADLRELHLVPRRGRALHPAHDPPRPLHRPPDPGAGAARARHGGMSFVEVQNVSKRFGDNVVLRNVDLTVEEHGVVCLIGASGSGKSTLLRCVNLLEKVEEGSISVDGQLVTNGSIDVNALRRKIGIVFQAYNLFPHMTVLENVTLAPRKARGIGQKEARLRALELLSRIGLADKADEFPDRLSGGQQQRVAIVRALAMDPKLMLLDEITSALDPQLVAEVLNLVRELADSGMTMIIATHEMSFAKEVADKVCFLDVGVICEEGPPEQIFSNPTEPRTREFLARIIEAGRL